MAVRTRHSPAERESVGSNPGPCTLFFLHFKGQNGNWIVLRRIGDKPTVPTFLLKTHFRMRRIYMGRNDDNSGVTLTIRTVPLPF